uniref:Succinate--CoA ligase [ADP-forming] subunit beta n=1 Tax=candidate division WOR-3 bacterium TaxID=2052148 RepID=A0A7C6EAG0_UNCW3
MKIHEYQAKAIFAEYGIPVGKEKIAQTPKEAKAIAQELGMPVVIKAQVKVGGRGKAGGIKLVERIEDVEPVASQILQMTIKGIPVKKVLVAQAIAIQAEYYLGITIDRSKRKPILLASAAGGIDIEEIARTSPKKIIKQIIEPQLCLLPFQARNIGFKLFTDAKIANEFSDIALKLNKIFFDKDCSLVEINPLALTTTQQFFALDAKIVFDDNGLFLHPELKAYEDYTDEEVLEVKAKQAGLSYVKLSGNVGCVVNGAGLAMATMDLIKRLGGEPANFLDIGGSSSPEKMATAMNIILADKNVKVILINIFGGITRCDDVASGLLSAIRGLHKTIPIVARLTGTNETLAHNILKGSTVIPAKTMVEAVQKAVALAQQRRANQ